MHTVGVDIVEVYRVQGALDRFGERFLNRIYTELEIRFCRLGKQSNSRLKQ